MQSNTLDGWVIVRHPRAARQIELRPPGAIDLQNYMLLRWNPHVRRAEYVHVSELSYWREQLRKERRNS